MTLWQAIVYGIVQGLTEFLPISSSAHLRIVPALLGWEDPGAAFTAVIQIGTLTAVLWYFRDDIARILSGVLRSLHAGRLAANPDAKMGWMIVVGTVPIVVAGKQLKDLIEKDFRVLVVVAGAMITLALILAVAECLARRRMLRHIPERKMADLGWTDAVLVGLAQVLALVPGTSRSGVTITAGLFLGMERATAARFSFLLSLPAVFAAGIYQLYKERERLLGSSDQAVNLIVATAVSGLVGYWSIAFLLHYLKTRTTLVFILYRLFLGSALLILLWQGVLR